MPFFTSAVDGARLHYLDYIPATTPTPFRNANPATTSPITLVFIHGWPMSSAQYTHLLLPLCETHRFRCIASDRRGFGKSEWNGHTTGGKPTDITYDTFAADTVALLELLKLDSFVFVAASMGCGETLLAYNSMSSSLKASCKGFLWLGASLPYPVATEENPDAPKKEVWDSILAGFREDRVGFTKGAIGGVFGTTYNIGVEVKETLLERFVNIVNEADALAIERCVNIISEKDLSSDLKKLDGEKVVLRVVHGDSDFGMPAQASANLIPKYVSQAEVMIYEKAAHGMYLTHAEKVLEEILDVVKLVSGS